MVFTQCSILIRDSPDVVSKIRGGGGEGVTKYHCCVWEENYCTIAALRAVNVLFLEWILRARGVH